MRKRTAVAATSILCLSACMAQLDITQDPIDFERISTKNAPKVTDVDTATIRTIIENADGKTVEIGGAACAIQSRQFRARFTTPAKIRFPRTHGKPEPMVLTCKARDKSQTLTLLPGLHANIYGVNTGELFSTLVITAITATASADYAKDRNRWSFARNGDVLRLPLE